MKKCTASSSSGPEDTVKDTTFPDPLTELLRKGARDLIAKAVEAELEALLEACSSLCLLQNRKGQRISLLQNTKDIVRYRTGGCVTAPATRFILSLLISPDGLRMPLAIRGLKDVFMM